MMLTEEDVLASLGLSIPRGLGGMAKVYSHLLSFSHLCQRPISVLGDRRMSNRIEKALAAFVDGILSLEIAARDAETGGWKLSKEDDESSSRGGTFTYETRVVKDWRTPLHFKWEDIHAMPETERLVQAIHQETKAELPSVRGVISDVAASFMRTCLRCPEEIS